MTDHRSQDKTLLELHRSHSGKVSDKWESYLINYDSLFNRFREKKVNILEIGVQNGGSLEIWAKYFHNFEKIVGCDIDPGCADISYSDNKISIVVGDINASETMQSIINISSEFDIIIDDGSHKSGDIVKSFLTYYPYLKPGGLFIVEDLHCSYWPYTHDGGLNAPFSSISFFKRLSDFVNFEFWQNEKESSQVLSDFFDTYGIALEQKTLRTVESVLFLNSICAIQKSTGAYSALGKRIVAGTDTPVMSSINELNDTYLIPPGQTENPWKIGVSGSEGTLIEHNNLKMREQELFDQLAKQKFAADVTIERVNSELRLLRQNTSSLNNEFLRISSLLEHPMRSWIVSKAAAWAAHLPGLSDRRREKFQSSANKRDGRVILKMLGKNLSCPQHKENVQDNPTLSGQTFLFDDIDDQTLSQAFTTTNVDVVVCVHNALDDLKVCLSSIVANTRPPYRLILVDDGSGDDTKEFLEDFSAKQGAKLLRNDIAGGYTRAANCGFRVSDAPWTVLINSDTIVPYGWIDELLKVGLSDDKIGIVGPASNTASWQSVPKLFNDKGHWAENPLPESVSVQDMQSIVASVAPPQGINLPFLNGFVLAIRKSLIEDIGIFDEETFGAGYGEENDYCIRAREAGWKLAFAPRAYVYHTQSASYSTEKRLELAASADKNLRSKHDAEKHIFPQVRYCKDSLATLSFRSRVAAKLDEVGQPDRPYEGKRIAVFCPVAYAGGGGNILVQESLSMIELGAQVWLINLKNHQHRFEETYPDSPPSMYFESPEEVRAFLSINEMNFDAVVASAYSTVDWLPENFKGRTPNIGYYIQDDEVTFFHESSRQHKEALKSYEILHRGCQGFTKTKWTADAVERRGFPRPSIVGPSVDLCQFYPNGRDTEARKSVRIAAMLRFESGIVDRRAPEKTMRILNFLAETFGDAVELIVFGSELIHEKKSGLDKSILDLGVLRPGEVASLFRNIDVFLDFSLWQAMGLSAMEAMASGCTVVVPREGGAPEFCIDEHNGLIVDSKDEDACIAAAIRLIKDRALRERLQKNATKDICKFSQERSARAILEVLIGSHS